MQPPRTLDQILTQLAPTYDPQVQSLQTQQQAIPGQIAAQQAGLAQQQNDAFGQIQAGAQQRGVGFSGIPLGEQAKYTASTYLPALANLQTAGTQQSTSLQDAINQVNQNRNNFAQQLYGQDQATAASAAAAAAQNAGLSSLFGGGSTDTSTPAANKNYTQKADGGFAFTNEYGNPISAAQYAAATNTPFRDLLQVLARQGDKGAATALNFVGNDYGYDPTKITTPELANLYNSLIWGTKAPQASVYSPAKAAVNPNAGNHSINARSGGTGI